MRYTQPRCLVCTSLLTGVLLGRVSVRSPSEAGPRLRQVSSATKEAASKTLAVSVPLVVYRSKIAPTTTCSIKG